MGIKIQAADKDRRWFVRKEQGEWLKPGLGWLGGISLVLAVMGMAVMLITSWWQGQKNQATTFIDAASRLVKESERWTDSPTPELPAPAWLPELKTATDEPTLSAESLVVMDVDSAVTLYQENEDQRWPPASITKVMTAMVALEHWPLADVITIRNLKVEGSKIKLILGEKITVENLLYGMLVASGNDAAEALAEAFPGGKDEFINAMNEKARSWHLEATEFKNPHGIDEEGHVSTAKDIARMTVMALNNDEFSKIIATDKIVIQSVDGKIIHRLETTNQLLSRVNGVKGVKTGWTEEAGESLVTLTERNEHRIITVVLGSKDRFGETEKLIEWVFANTQWKDAASTGI